MSEFRLGWFCYIIQKCEKKKRNQEDFINTVLSKLVAKNNPNISFAPEINRVSSNRIFTGDEDVPEFYREALPLTDLEAQSLRISNLLKELNRDENFDFKQAVSKIKNNLSENAKEAKRVFGDDKLKKLNSTNEDELYLSILLVFLVNISNIPTADNEILRNSKIIQENILKFLDNEIILSLFPHRLHFDELLNTPEVNKIFYLEFYSPHQLAQTSVQQNFGVPTLRFLLRDTIERLPLVQNGLILQNGIINERIQKFISDNFQNTDRGILLAGFCDSFELLCKILQQYFPKEVNGKLFEIDKMVLSIKTRYDHTADCMKEMIGITNKTVEFLEKQQYTSKENIELTVGGLEELRSGEMVCICLVKSHTVH
ncbi:TPA: hypothetical protein U1V26_001507 [Streptococcus suis]|uniref:hypothetical protein n=1 Tax=Streptococcus suis TaxID=1307 RepID=UPI0015570872|nr:hypothetical protein [Streptococcus suis]NQO91005.1 hypothetical protein [Streptococcus suis]HEM3931768.1 hypothetical protein [Streptococcus suis]HEM3945709.1 hypothetical protein [Streptococcus suis]HEM3959645.1 hypothetical protein [Streptococcus suis]